MRSVVRLFHDYDVVRSVRENVRLFHDYGRCSFHSYVRTFVHSFVSLLRSSDNYVGSIRDAVRSLVRTTMSFIRWCDSRCRSFVGSSHDDIHSLVRSMRSFVRWSDECCSFVRSTHHVGTSVRSMTSFVGRPMMSFIRSFTPRCRSFVRSFNPR